MKPFDHYKVVCMNCGFIPEAKFGTHSAALMFTERATCRKCNFKDFYIKEELANKLDKVIATMNREK